MLTARIAPAGHLAPVAESHGREGSGADEGDDPPTVGGMAGGITIDDAETARIAERCRIAWGLEDRAAALVEVVRLWWREHMGGAP